MKAKPPDLNDERLTQMHLHASQIWRGERQPTIRSAEDVLFLVAEVRRLRELTKYTVTETETKATVHANSLNSLGNLIAPGVFGRDRAFTDMFRRWFSKDAS